MLKRFVLCLAMAATIGMAVGEVVEYDDPVLHLRFMLNTVTKEAMIGNGIDTYQNAFVSAPIGQKWWDSNETNLWMNLTVPGTVSYEGETYVVTKVASYAFSDSWDLRTIVLPAQIREIGYRAFYKSCYITSVKLPDSLKTIGAGAFAWSTRLPKIEIPDGVTEIPASAFDMCIKLEKIKLPINLTRICNSAFMSCYVLDSLSIPGKCMAIDQDAFTFCMGLKVLRLEDGSEPITMSYAYEFGEEWDAEVYNQVNEERYYSRFCRGLFNDCALRDLYVGRNIIQSEVPAKYTVSPFELWRSRSKEFKSQEGHYLNSLKFGPLVTIIPDGMFKKGLVGDNFALPPSVKYIGKDAFYSSYPYCDFLTIPASCDSIAEGAFYGWGNIRYIICESEEPCHVASNFITGRTSYGEDCKMVIAVMVPDGSGINYQKADIWQNFTIVDKVPGGDTVSVELKYAGSLSGRLKAMQKEPKEIRNLVLKGKINEKDLAVVKTMTKLCNLDISGLLLDTLPDMTFAKWTLRKIKFPANLTRIKERQFYGFCLCDTLVLPETCTSVGDNAFFRALFDKVVLKGGGIIGKSVFSKNLLLKEVETGGGTVVLSSEAFTDSPLETVCLGKGTTVESNAFKKNTQISKLYLKNGVKSLQDNAFPATLTLDSLFVEGGVSQWSANAFSVSTSTLKVLSIESLDDWCSISFSTASSNPMVWAEKTAVNGRELQVMTLSDKVTKIGDYCFVDCQSLKKVQLPGHPVAVGKGTFQNCKNLVSLDGPEGFSSVGEGAFAGCGSLTEVALSTQLKDLGASAFSGCVSLKSIDLPERVLDIPAGLFAGCKSLASVVIPDSVKSIGSSSFYNCPALKTVVIPNSVSSIGESAFGMDSLLEAVKLPKGLLSIGKLAFSNCISLEEMDFPVNLQTVEAKAFCNCTSLNKMKAYWTNPPSIPVNVFDGIPYTASIQIPFGTGQLYYDTGWGQIPEVEECYYFLKLKSKSGGASGVGDERTDDYDCMVAFEENADLEVDFYPERLYYVNGVFLDGDGYKSDSLYFGIVDDNKVLIEHVASNLSLSPNFEQFVHGDVNFDFDLNIADVPAMINVIQQTPLPSYHPFTADVNEDGSKDIGDVVAIVNMIVDGYEESAKMAPPANMENFESEVDMQLMRIGHDVGVMVCIQNDNPVSGVQLEFRLPSGYDVPIDNSGKFKVYADEGIKCMDIFKTVRLTDGIFQVLIASMDGGQIERGQNRLFFIPLVANGRAEDNDGIIVVDCKLVDSDAVVYTCSETKEISMSDITRLITVSVDQTMSEEKFIIDNTLYINKNGVIYHIGGMKVSKDKE